MDGIMNFYNKKYGTLKAFLKDDKVYVCTVDLLNCIGLSASYNVTKYLDKSLIVNAKPKNTIGRGFNFIEEMNILKLCFTLTNTAVVDKLKDVKKHWIDKEIKNTLSINKRKGDIDYEIQLLWHDVLQQYVLINMDIDEKLTSLMLTRSKCTIQDDVITVRIKNDTVIENDFLNNLARHISKGIEDTYNISYKVKFILAKQKENIYDNNTIADDFDITSVVNNVLLQRNRRINAIYSDEMRNMIFTAVKVILKKPSILAFSKDDKDMIVKITNELLDFVDSYKH